MYQSFKSTQGSNTKEEYKEYWTSNLVHRIHLTNVCTYINKYHKCTRALKVHRGGTIPTKNIGNT